MEITELDIDTKNFKIQLAQTGHAVDALLRRHVDDVANQVQSTAERLAPRGPSGRLKAEGVIKHAEVGESLSGIVTGARAFGGGFSVRGAGGRFVGATKAESPGTTLSSLANHSYSAVVELNPAVPHAKWVHGGTGIFGPYKSPIVPRRAEYLVFYWHGRKWRKKSVRGQRPQPFLTEAFEYVRNVYEPAKLSQLRAEIDAVT